MNFHPTSCPHPMHSIHLMSAIDFMSRHVFTRTRYVNQNLQSNSWQKYCSDESNIKTKTLRRCSSLAYIIFSILSLFKLTSFLSHTQFPSWSLRYVSVNLDLVGFRTRLTSVQKRATYIAIEIAIVIRC